MRGRVADRSGRESRRQRVLMLTGFPAIGGPLPKLAPLVADGLRERGFDVEIAGWSAHTAGAESLPAKVVERSLDLLHVLRHVLAWHPDVVYVATSHNWPALLRDLPLMLTVPRWGLPVVLHLHGSDSARLAAPGSRLFKMLSAVAVRRAAVVMLLSSEEKDEWRRFIPGVRFELVTNPFVPTSPDGQAHVDGAGFGAAPETGVTPAAVSGPPVLLTVARLIRQKGVFDLLDAFSMARKQRPCRLVYAGTGPEAVELSRRVGERGLGDSVRLVGYVEGAALEREYGSAAVFVLPSYFAEGFPLAVMEAMSHGLPVITTPIRGCADYLVDGEHALFVPPRSPAELAAALLRLLNDPSLRERMGAANRAKVMEFTPERVIPRYADILHSVMASGDVYE